MMIIISIDIYKESENVKYKKENGIYTVKDMNGPVTKSILQI